MSEVAALLDRIKLWLKDTAQIRPLIFAGKALMPQNLSTTAFFIRRVVIITAVSVAASVGITLLALRAVWGGNPNVTIPAAQLEWFALTLSSITPAIICPVACFRTAQATAAIERARLDLDFLARTDQLTGLLNRRGFDAAAQ